MEFRREDRGLKQGGEGVMKRRYSRVKAGGFAGTHSGSTHSVSTSSSEVSHKLST